MGVDLAQATPAARRRDRTQRGPGARDLGEHDNLLTVALDITDAERDCRRELRSIGSAASTFS